MPTEVRIHRMRLRVASAERASARNAQRWSGESRYRRPSR